MSNRQYPRPRNDASQTTIGDILRDQWVNRGISSSLERQRRRDGLAAAKTKTALNDWGRPSKKTETQQ